jgi:hypothetical protein
MGMKHIKIQEQTSPRMPDDFWETRTPQTTPNQETSTPQTTPNQETRTPQTTPTSTQVKDDGVYTPCKGFNKLFCKSDSIKKVQTCLELEPTGNYDQKLNNILGSYGFLSGFNDTDVERICNEVQRRKEGQKRLDSERDAKIQQEKREQEEFRRQYPQTIQNPATETDDWG